METELYRIVTWVFISFVAELIKNGQDWQGKLMRCTVNSTIIMVRKRSDGMSRRRA